MYQKLFDQQKQKEMRDFFLDLCSEVSLQSFAKGEEISLKNQKSFAIVADGRVKQSLFSQNGCEKSLYILQAGEIFGEMDYFNNSQARIINKVLEDCQVAVIKKERLEKKLAAEPKIYRYFIHSISRKFRIVMLQLSGLVFNDSAGKLAEILIRLAAQEGKKSQTGVIIDLKLTHQEISDLIGCSRSTVSRELNNFKKENIITTDSKKIIIKDPTALRSYINPICK